MAENKYCPYSFYIPVKDSQLTDFIDAQSNLSMSIRLLIKAFIARYEQDIPDVTTMDLRNLINSMDLDEAAEKLQSGTEAVSIAKAKADISTEMSVDLSETVSDDTDKEPVLKSGTKNRASKPEQKPKPEPEVQESAEKQETIVEMSQLSDDGSEESDKPDGRSGDKSDQKSNFGTDDDSDDESEDDLIPAVTVEPESPQKSNGRDAYNNAQNANNQITEDDIMALMGET